MCPFYINIEDNILKKLITYWSLNGFNVTNNIVMSI